jgi:hypothetical protein
MNQTRSDLYLDIPRLRDQLVSYVTNFKRMKIRIKKVMRLEIAEFHSLKQ